MKKIVPWLIVLFWLGVIYYFSYQPAPVSDELSLNVTAMLVQFINLIIPDADLQARALNHLVRKQAHFFIYLVLGIMVMWAVGWLRFRGWKRVIVSLILCVLFAIFDEIHQLFVPGRGAQVKDVLIDTLGASIGIGLCFLATKKTHRNLTRK